MRVRHLMALLVGTVLAVFGLATPAHATGVTYVWVGASTHNPGSNDYDWGNANNWAPNGVPGNGDSVEIAPPTANDCHAHVVNMPAVTLAGFDLHDYTDGHDTCEASTEGTSLTVTGTFHFDGGDIDAPFTLAAGANGLVNGTTPFHSQFNADTTIAGTLTLSGSSGPGTLRQNGDHLFDITSTGRLVSSGDNAISASACCTYGTGYRNDGTIEVDNGTLDVDTTFSQRNAVVLNSGTLLLDGIPAESTNHASYQGTGTWSVQDTDLTLAGTSTLAKNVTLAFGSLTDPLPPELSGTGTLGGTGLFQWNSGQIDANLTLAHALRTVVSGNPDVQAARVLSGNGGGGTQAVVTNHGTLAFRNNATVAANAHARLVNAADGTATLAAGTTFTGTGADAIVNAGQLSIPAGTITRPVVLDGVGYTVQAGAVNAIASGQTLRILDSDASSWTTAQFTGGGSVVVGATVDLSGTQALAGGMTLTLADGGQLDGPAALAGDGQFVWTGGDLSDALSIDTQGGMMIGGTDDKTIVGGASGPSTITVDVPLSVAAGTSATHDYVSIGESTLVLNSTTTVAANVELSAGNLVNNGTLTVDPGANKTVYRTFSGTTVNTGIFQLLSGKYRTDEVFEQRAGTSILAAGTVFDDHFSGAPLTVTGGTLAGSGQLTGGLENDGGTVAPGGSAVAKLTVAGNYTEAAAGTLLLDIAPGSNDVLAVGGSATVGGTVVGNNVSAPALGATAKVMTVSGGFSFAPTCVITSGPGSTGTGAQHWSATASAHALNLRSVNGRRTAC